jgi:heterodisulfide reductase subunit C
VGIVQAIFDFFRADSFYTFAQSVEIPKMEYIDNILFALITVAALGFFGFQFSKIWKSIQLGMAQNRRDRMPDRINRMLLVAFGQQKMFKKPLPAVLHGLVYVGFLVINIELIEIIIDGIAGTHRALSFLGFFYDGLMAVNEVLGFLVVVACVILLWRRNVLKVKRFTGTEMGKWPRMDANIILITEIVLMACLFTFNTVEYKSFADLGATAHLKGIFPVSMMLAKIWPAALTTETVMLIGWWGHVLGIFAFLNYIPRSKHFHIIMAFPNVYASKLEAKGKLENIGFITNEVRAMLDPSTATEGDGTIPRFGARDVIDLPWTTLMNAYACTECGRCTSVCPANITGKKLSPRKIIMDTRDRMEDLQKLGLSTVEAVKNHGEESKKFLLGEHISAEELWACTTCNACVEACPVNIDHVSEIVALRQYIVMEESKAPQSINMMLTNIQNNGAPWGMSASARFDWSKDVEMPAHLVAGKG